MINKKGDVKGEDGEKIKMLTIQKGGQIAMTYFTLVRNT
jgi:hypothetical protein